MYRNLVGTPIEEYRHAIATVQHLITEEGQPRCPACPKVYFKCGNILNKYLE